MMILTWAVDEVSGFGYAMPILRVFLEPKP